MIFGIKDVLWKTALGGMLFSATFALAGSLILFFFFRWYIKSRRSDTGTDNFIQKTTGAIIYTLVITIGAVFSIGGSLVTVDLYQQFHAATRVMTHCQAIPAWITTYTKIQWEKRSDGPDDYVYCLFADISARDQRQHFPEAKNIAIETGVDTSNRPSPIVTHAPGFVYLPEDKKDPIVIFVAKRYIVSRT